MKRTAPFAIALAAVAFTTGCETTGLSRREQANVSYPNYILNLQPKASSTAPPTLTLPLHLAVVQVGEPAPPKLMLDKLQVDRSLVASVVGLPSWAETRGQSNDTEVVSGRVQAICRLAQSVGANHVFIFGGNTDTWADGNVMRLFDFTLVGAVLVPSTKIHAEGKAAGTLIETSACDPQLLVNVDAKRTAASPTNLTNGKTDTLRAQLRDELIAALADELLRKLASRQNLVTTRPSAGALGQAR